MEMGYRTAEWRKRLNAYSREEEKNALVFPNDFFLKFAYLRPYHIQRCSTRITDEDWKLFGKEVSQMTTRSPFGFTCSRKSSASCFTKMPPNLENGKLSAQRLESGLPISPSRPGLRAHTRTDVHGPTSLRPRLQLSPDLGRALRGQKPSRRRKRELIRQHQRPHRVQIHRPHHRKL